MFLSHSNDINVPHIARFTRTPFHICCDARSPRLIYVENVEL